MALEHGVANGCEFGIDLLERRDHLKVLIA